MNSRDRFNRMLRYEPVDRLPVVVVEPYEEPGLERWRNEGLPADVSPVDYLGMDAINVVCPPVGPIPAFEKRMLSETAEDFIEQDWMGATVRRHKVDPSTYYGYIDHPVKNRDDWERYKERLDLSSPERFDNLDEEIDRLNASDSPTNLIFFPFFFRLGFYLMGMERFMTAFYETPELMHDMFGYFGQFTLDVLGKTLPRLKVDIASFGEDLAYKNGPHVSPRIYEEFWLPYQDPIVEELRRNGVEFVAMYTAGNIRKILPMLMEHGFNCTYPLERAAGMDPVELRREYGRDLRLIGGFPKEALIAGPAAIDAEIHHLMPVIEDGGFIPALDDMVPPEVPLNHYRYYVDALHNIKRG